MLILDDTVVLANKFGGVIFHDLWTSAETTQIERGTTPFANKLNEKSAHESVAIDEGISEGSFGSLSVDDEGINLRRVLIKDGFKNLSKRAGELRTG